MKTKTEKTVRIYRLTCDKAYSAYEQGSGYSLSPWGANTEYYHGSDDGGQMYILPDGFRVAETVGDGQMIFDPSNRACELVTHSSGKPQIVTLKYGMPVLNKTPDGSNNPQG